MQEQRKTNTNTPRHDTIGLEKTYFFRAQKLVLQGKKRNMTHSYACYSVAKALFMTSYRADWISGAFLCEGKNQRRQ